MIFDLIFITTTQNNLNVSNLLDSIYNFNNKLNINIILLLQNSIEINQEKFQNEYTTINVITTNKKYSLSKARNICIDYIIDNGIKSKYIMFPDDDTTFDSSFFMNFKSTVTQNSLIDVYCTGTKHHYQDIKQLTDGSLTSDYKYAMSVNMIINYEHFIDIGKFDEDMGVGAKYGAGEDGDYFLRTCKKYGSFKVYHNLYNFHPAPDRKYEDLSLAKLIKRYKTYGEGVIYLLYKHNKPYQAIICIIYGLLGSIKSCLFEFNLKLSLARICGFWYRLKCYLYCSIKVPRISQDS
jgi:hypothetical protein